MSKHKLQRFPVALQQYPNSCWACCSRMINNYFILEGRGAPGRTIYLTDDGITTAAGAPFSGTTSVMNSASGLLIDLGYENEIDGEHVPTLDEMLGHLRNGNPLLSLLTTAKPPDTDIGNIDGSMYGGHWVVITGVDTGLNKVKVFDPDTSLFYWVDYDTERCFLNGVTYFWGNTSYVDPGCRVVRTSRGSAKRKII